MANHDPTQDKHHFSPVFKNGGYAMSTLGRYAVSFLLGALSAAFMFGIKSQTINDLVAFKGKQEAINERFDTYGTNASKMKVEAEDVRITANTIAILDLQKKLEPLGAMQVKIDRLERDMASHPK